MFDKLQILPKHPTRCWSHVKSMKNSDLSVGEVVGRTEKLHATDIALTTPQLLERLDHVAASRIPSTKSLLGIPATVNFCRFSKAITLADTRPRSDFSVCVYLPILLLAVYSFPCLVSHLQSSLLTVITHAEREDDEEFALRVQRDERAQSFTTINCYPLPVGATLYNCASVSPSTSDLIYSRHF